MLTSSLMISILATDYIQKSRGQALLFSFESVAKFDIKVKLTMYMDRAYVLQTYYSPKQPRTSFPFYKFFYPTISARISVQLRRTILVRGYVS